MFSPFDNQWTPLPGTPVHCTPYTLQFSGLFTTCCRGESTSDFGGYGTPAIVLIVLHRVTQSLHLVNHQPNLSLCSPSDGLRKKNRAAFRVIPNRQSKPSPWPSAWCNSALAACRWCDPGKNPQFASTSGSCSPSIRQGGCLLPV